MRIREERTAEQVIMECEAKIKMGVDIARAESLRESEEAFKRVMPHIHSAFYDYIKTGYNSMSRFTVTTEDMERVESPLIPVRLSFMYNMIEHLFAYNCTIDKEVQSRLEDLFEFIKGFEEVGYGVFVKLQDEWVYIVNTNTGTTYKKKYKNLEYIDINKDFYYLTGVTSEGKTLTLTDAYMDISRRKGWKRTGVKLEKGYVRIQHKKMYFREHLVIVALVYGIEVAKHLLGRNSFLTIDHIDGCEYNNKITNLRVVTRETNRRLIRDKGYKAYDFLDMYKGLRDTYKDYKLL